MKKVLIFAALAGLTACAGGAPTISPPLNPINTTVGNANITGTVPSGTANFTIIGADGTTVAYTGPRDPALTSATYGGIEIPTASADGTFDVVAFSDDGIVTPGQTSYVNATIIGVSQNVTGNFGQVARYKRVNQSVLPTAGGGTYLGEYRGVLGSSSGTVNGAASGTTTGSGLAAIIGNLELTANFANARIGGFIKNRDLQLSSGVTALAFNKVILVQTDIRSDGTFIDAATGGAYKLVAGSSTAPGTYQGLIGGTNGRWTAGAVQLTHLINGVQYFELGVFTGKK